MIGANRFRWKKGSKPQLYGLDRLDTAKKAGYLVVVEGESDCHTLWFRDIPALGVPGATNWKEERDAARLDGVATVYVVIEPDKGGEAVERWLSRSRIRDRVRLVSLGAHKDPSALYLADPATFATSWLAAIGAAVPWQEREAQEAAARGAAAWEQCSALAQEPNILARLDAELTESGLVGERHAAALVYLAATSRLLAHPVSVVVKGPSSSGKSFVVKKVLELFPSDAYHAVTTLSGPMLARDTTPLKHRMLLIYEAAGVRDDFSSMLIRTLLSEGHIKYDVMVKSGDDWVPAHFEREGPTGLLMTTTALRLHPENETRMLSVTVADTPEQTRRVLQALSITEQHEADVNPWWALQTWLSTTEVAVSIPYAPALAALVPPSSPRMKRDYRALLGLIEAHALLHQASRQRDGSGRIKATLGDYDAVRELVAPLFADLAQAAVPPDVRRTVDAVKQLRTGLKADVSQVELGKALSLDKAGTSRAVHKAIDYGYLKNLEEKRGRPARLLVGDPIPNDQEVLPTVEQLRCFTVEGAGEDMTTLSPPPTMPTTPLSPEGDGLPF